MKGIFKKILVGFIALLGAFILFLLIRFFTLPRLDPTYVYNGHEYYYIIGKFETSRNQSSVAREKAVARFYDAIIYTIKDDPDEFYLSPKVILAHLPYNLLGRRDMMQPPTEENVDHIDINVSKGDEPSWKTMDLSTQHALLEAYSKSTIDPTEYELINMFPTVDKWQAKTDYEIFDVRIWFKKPNDLYYNLLIIKIGNEYGLLLEDGETLIEFDGSLLGL